MALISRLKIKNFFGKIRKLAKPKIYALFIVAVLILSTFAGLILQQAKPTPVDCAAVVKQADQFLNESNNTKAHELLKRNETICSSSNDRLINIQYNARLAVTTYESGDKAKAKTYADKTLELSGGLSPQEKSKAPNQQSIEIYMHDIARSRYSGLGGLE